AENIKKLRGEDIDVHALCTITSDSLDKGKEIVDEYLDLGMDYIWLRPLNKIGFAGESWEEIGYTAGEFVNFYSETLDYILQEGNIKELYAVLLAKKILGVRDPEMTEMTSPCGAGISQLLYDYRGDIYTCDEAKVFEEFKLGNVEYVDWEDVFTSETLLSMVDISSKKNYLCNNCEWEPFCSICPVNTYSEQGTIVSKLPEDYRCKLYSGLIEDVFKRLLFNQDQREVLQKWAKQSEIFG
ncbi:MAG: radical SAM protein, partial [Candidatus Aenigmatarchaeota archaeon]